MLPKNSVKPLELVVSAIHCLREKKGSSPQNILRYLVGKYNVNTEMLKPHIQTGLKRGIGFGIITHQSGLYRLNDVLTNPLGSSALKIRKNRRIKVPKRSKTIKKVTLRQLAVKKGKRKCFQPVVFSQKNKKKLKKIKYNRKKLGGTSRRIQNEVNKRRQKRKIPKKVSLKNGGEKPKKLIKDESQQPKQDASEDQKLESSNHGEAAKTNVKT